VELQDHKAEFDAAGIKLFAISYDSVEALGAFADHYGIEYPILSDIDSKVIRDFGILNTLVLPHETEFYGIPYPGSYLVGTDGLVTAKFFNQQYQARETAPAMMHAGFGLPIDPAHLSHAETNAGDGVNIRAELMTRTLHPRQRSLIYVTLELAEGLHVYGEPISDGFLPTTVIATGTEGLTFGEPQFPETKPLKIEEIDEEFNAFDGNVEIVIPVGSTIREVGKAEIELKVSFQACTDAMCYIPRTETIKLELATAPNVPKVE
jgi:hypothetical protein